MCNKTNMHHSMLINAVNHTYPNYYSHLADVLFCLTGIFTYQTDALPSRVARDLRSKAGVKEVRLYNKD